MHKCLQDQDKIVKIKINNRQYERKTSKRVGENVMRSRIRFLLKSLILVVWNQHAELSAECDRGRT